MVYDRGGIDTIREFNGRVFSTPEEKVQTVEHIRIAPREADFMFEKHTDSLFREEVRLLLNKNAKDNFDVKKHIHHMDSIQLLNADQMFQIKEQLKQKR